MTVKRVGGARIAVLVGIGLAAIGICAWLLARQAGTEHRAVQGCSWRAISAGSVGARWPACRRPYSADSPFNQRLGDSPRLAPDSSTTVARVFGLGAVTPAVFGDSARDGGVAIYRSRPHDPLYTLHCTKPWGRCEIEGARVRIPAAARPAGVWPDRGDVSDGHLTVVDPRSMQEYDLWNVESKPPRGGRLAFAWGGRTRIDGGGLGSAAVASGRAGLAGVVRARELVSGRIDHALSMVVPCTQGRVYPANGQGLSCASLGLPATGAPAMGARLQLAMSDRQIAALQLPRWQRGILRALSRYGAFVSDTNGQSHAGFEYESPADYGSFGDADPRIALAKRLGVQPEDFNHNGQLEYWLPFSAAVDWGRMRVIAPCVSRETCD